MSAYIARRILLMLPTLLGILFISFVVVQFAPGGPVERVIAQLSGADTGGTSRVSGGSGDFGARGGQVGAAADAVSSKYRGAQGLDPYFIKKLEVQFGFDKAVTILSFAVLGGVTSQLGAVLGAIILSALPEVLRPLHDFRLVFNGLIIVLVVIFLPRGILGFPARRLG